MTPRTSFLRRGQWDFCGAPVGVLGITAFLLILCIANTLLMLGLEDSFLIEDHFTKKRIPESFYQKYWWKYLLPQSDVYGTWASTTVVAGALVQQYVYPAIVLVFSHNVLICVGFVVALALTKSLVFSATVALLFVTVPFNFHVHAVSGTTAQALLVSYFLMTVHASYLVLMEPTRFNKYYLLAAALLFVLGYETWLDTVVVLLILAAPLILILWRLEEFQISKRFGKYVVGVVATMLVYIFIKVYLGFRSGEGTETDLIFHYDNLFAMIDDYASKVVAFFFTAISLVLPPELAGSLTLPRYGGQWIMDQQHNYHRPMQFLAYVNHIFLWRYFAGGYFVIVVGLGIWAMMRLWQGDTRWQIWVLFFCVFMLLFGASTHSVVKYRPMQSMPYLGYQVWVNVVGAIGLMALFVEFLKRWVSSVRPIVTITAAWVAIVVIGFSVRSVLGVFAQNMMMGNYPDPIDRLVRWLPAF